VVVMLEQYNFTHISTSTTFENFEGKEHIISEVIIDLFQDFNDPDHFVRYKVEHLNRKHLFSEFDLYLN
jgi:hypothetical protein